MFVVFFFIVLFPRCFFFFTPSSFILFLFFLFWIALVHCSNMTRFPLHDQSLGLNCSFSLDGSHFRILEMKTLLCSFDFRVTTQKLADAVTTESGLTHQLTKENATKISLRFFFVLFFSEIVDLSFGSFKGAFHCKVKKKKISRVFETLCKTHKWCRFAVIFCANVEETVSHNLTTWWQNIKGPKW